jgi:hypothetical protein
VTEAGEYGEGVVEADLQLMMDVGVGDVGEETKTPATLSCYSSSTYLSS